MTKKDLQTRMVVKTRKGDLYEVQLGAAATASSGTRYERADILKGEKNGWLDLKDYNEDLKFMGFFSCKEYDIMEVYLPKYFGTNKESFPKNYKLLWEREKAEKFYLKHRWLNQYLNFNILTGNYFLGPNDECLEYKTGFTRKEIEGIIEEIESVKYVSNIILDNFEVIPVKSKAL